MPIARNALLRHLPLIVIAAGGLCGLILLHDRPGAEALARHSAELAAFRDAHYGAAVALFVLAYVAVVTFSLPGATLATLAGGYLFGTFPGVVYNVAGATLGATLLFLAVRLGLGARFSARLAGSGGAVARLQAGVQENQWSALLVMRLLPVVPFFLANLLPAFAGVRLWPFVVTTGIGIFPATLIFTSVGAGVQDLLAGGTPPDLASLTSPRILAPLAGLAALAALPMLVRVLRRKGA